MTGKRPKLFVAMSGGVDSSVAAWLLQQEGYDVVGVTFRLFADIDEAKQEERSCCSWESVTRARAVCDRLGVPHYVMNFADDFRRCVVERFVREYGAGRTPNPCVDCNRFLKFELFLWKARAIGADYIATGHYARLRAANGIIQLLPAADRTKDQSYVLCHLNQTTLPYLRLPIGEYTKAQVRAFARQAGLPTAETAESQDICFIQRGHYAEFLRRYGLPEAPGPIVDMQGRVLGEHRGLWRYTVGQRKGLGVSVGERLYVVAKRIADNTLIVGTYRDVCRTEVEIAEVNWCDLPAAGWPDEIIGRAVEAMLRYRQKPVAATIEAAAPEKRQLRLHLARPAIAAPGQILTMYAPEDGHVLGGGIIL